MRKILRFNSGEVFTKVAHDNISKIFRFALYIKEKRINLCDSFDAPILCKSSYKLSDVGGDFRELKSIEIA